MDNINIADEFLIRIKNIQDSLAQVVTIHLFTEYWLDKILYSQCNEPDALPRQLNYKNKLAIVHSLVKLPSGLYDNLSKLNKLRNQCAHNLKFDFDRADYSYDMSSIDWNDSAPLSEWAERERVIWIGMVTFGWLHNYSYDELNLLDGDI